MISLSPTFSGRFRVVKTKSSGEVTFDKSSSNVVLDAGIKDFYSALVTMGPVTIWNGNDADAGFNRMAYLFLGTGTSEPSAADSGLENRSGTLPGKLKQNGTDPNMTLARDTTHWGLADTDNHVYWNEMKFEFRYGEGEAEGVWTELGLANDSNYSSPFTRALFRDENGDPISLTVLSDEFLQVFYTIRFQDGLGAPKEGTFDLNGVTHSYTLKNRAGNPYSGWLSSNTHPFHSHLMWGVNQPFSSMRLIKDDGNEYRNLGTKSATFDPATMTISLSLNLEPETDEIDKYINQISFDAFDGLDEGEHLGKGTHYMDVSPPIHKKVDYRLTLNIDIQLSPLGPAVTGVSATATSASLDFTWDAYPSATEYALVLRQAGTVIEEQTVTAPTAAASFTGLTAATEYHLAIQPKTAGRDGARSVHAATTGAA